MIGGPQARPPWLVTALALLGACAAPSSTASAPAPQAQAPPAPGVSPAALAAPAPAAAAPSASAEALERVLAAVRPDDLRADVRFLASGELGGRGTPSLGQRIAARFLQARMQRLGWTPGAEGGWFHGFELYARRLEAEGTRATWSSAGLGRPLVYGRDFGVHPSEPVGGSWTGGVVLAGTGTRPELAGLELGGRWLLCADGSGLERDHAGARAAGALGFLVVTADLAHAGTPPFEDWQQRLRRPFPRWPLPQDGDTLPTVRLAPACARELLADAGSASLPPAGTQLDGELSVTLAGAGRIALENVCALWPGEGPLASEVIIVSAHYDHVGVSPRSGEIYHGADDNGSGSAGLLALAEALTAHGPLERSVLLLWLSAEELGLLGARAWCEDPWLPEGLRPVANINLDMIGRNDGDHILLTPSPDHPERNRVADVLEAALREEGFARVEDGDEFWERSDHAMFAEHLGLPVAFACNGEHADYHQPSDTAEKLDYDKAARCARATLRALLELQHGPLGAPAR